jgi:hypothetical protein
MKSRKTVCCWAGCVALAGLIAVATPGVVAQNETQVEAHDRFMALPIAKGGAECPCARMLYKYGVPFVETAWHAPQSGSLLVNVGIAVKRIYLLGMTETQRPSAWSDPLSYAARYFVGDNLGTIRMEYKDGSTQEFPLILGESVWFGLPFEQTQDPFPSDAQLRGALAQAMRLYPAAPVEDGNYVAVIAAKNAPLASIEITDSKEKKESVAIAGITVEAAPEARIPGSTPIPGNAVSPGFARFVAEKPLRQAGADERESEQRLAALSAALYNTAAEYKQPVAARIPKGYVGPKVTFKGTVDAGILQNAFYANVQDMLDKVDADGTYHTSTRNALAWSGDPRSAGGEFGTYRKNVGVYAEQAWSRDLGRSLQELTELGYLDKASHTADFALRSARTWSENPALTYHSSPLPPHWSRVIDHPDFAQPFENDGHGLISLFIYKLWLRLPDRDAWLRAHWTDVKAAGDWIPWQFDHPEISDAANGVLYTTGESAAGKGYSVYPDTICMTALEALARMADSIGETQSAERWRSTAEKMRKAIPARYLIDDPKYGRVWTLESAGWPNKSTVLGPLIFTADYTGFAPQDDDPAWQAANDAAYQRLIDTYKPLGFYGWAMGYGQGFVTQAALLLDRMEDATTMLDWASKEIYDPKIDSFITPEGEQLDPTGKYWYSTGDLGNGVQEAEMVKVLRLVVGVDDDQPQRLRIMPRLPYGWTEIAVDKYPALVERGGKTETAHVHFDLRREAGSMSLEVSADRPLGDVAMRLGPFEKQPQAADVMVNGKHPAVPEIARSGDSWWVSFKAPVGPASAAAK